MSAVFFRKRIGVAAVITLAFTVLVGAWTYARFLDNAASYALSQNYYFLVSDSTHIEASTHEVVGIGGAGYLLSTDTRDYVAVSVYADQTAAERVQTQLVTPSALLKKEARTLYFKNGAEKKNAKAVIDGFSCMEDCIQLLMGITKRLDEGGTQQSCKRLLHELRVQFSYLSKRSEETFPAYARVCSRAATELETLGEGVLYAKDLRYVLCGLCDDYFRLSDEFSL